MCTTCLPLPCSCGERAVEGLERCPPCLARVYIHRGEFDAARALVSRELMTTERLEEIRREAEGYDVWAQDPCRKAAGRMR